jgi:hypothetical protein
MIDTFIDGIIAVVVGRKGLERIAMSPAHPANYCPAGGGSALTMTLLPVG